MLENANAREVDWMSSRPVRVMLVDDNEADNYLARLIIEESGLADVVLTFEDAALAISHLSAPDSHCVDLILLDIRMPRMDGFQFLDAYERLPMDRRANAVVVMLTTSLNPIDIERARCFDCVSDYLEKPLTEEQFIELVRSHLPGPAD